MNLSAIDLNLLTVLHAVLDEGSVAKAAERLHVTSPAVSNALARLRDVLKDPLFVRSGRGLVPTPKALELKPSLERVFAELTKSLSTDFDPRTCTQTFTIALSDADQVSSLPAISKRLARDLPSSQLLVVTLDTLMSTGGLAGNVDVTLGPPFPGDGLYREHLFGEDAVIVARRGHPRVKKQQLTKVLFNGERHVDVRLLLGRAGSGNRVAEDAFEKAGLKRNIAVTVPSFAAVASVVSSTEFLGGMPRRTAELYARAMPLQLLRGPGPTLRFEMFLHWHERTHRDPAHVAFRRVIAAALQDRHSRAANSD
ncbi:MAG: LysR family transcriptional regulator [Archangium sp.]